MSENVGEKESIVKSLLTSTTPLNLSSKFISTYNISNSRALSTHYMHSSYLGNSRVSDDSVLKMHNYYNQCIPTVDKDPGVIAMDHCYARPLNWTPESAFFQPIKTLFMSQAVVNKKKPTNPLAPMSETDDIIDVETVATPPPELYDKMKALHLMDECERHAVFARTDQDNDEWEDTVSRLNWTHAQNRLFNGMVNILNSDRLARLAYSNAHHESVLRRSAIDKSVNRVRHLFASISWDSRLTQWLHQLLIDNLSSSFLGAYLDILQTLKAKLPVFVDKMMYGPNATVRMGLTSNENLFQLLKRPWDPFGSYSPSRFRKLPGNPIIIMVSSSPSTSHTSHFKRQNKWANLLSHLCTVVAVHTNIGSSINRLTMINCADQMLAATRAKIQEVKSDYPGRPIVLVGFNAGSALSLQVAQVEHVAAVVCMGFSLYTAEGKRGDADDNMLELQSPVLFIIGQCSNTSLQEDVEDLRERMRVENALVVVGSADDYLRISKKKKRAEGITQTAVDRIIVENIGEFISGLLLSPYPPQVRQSPTLLDTTSNKRSKADRKRNNSNDSSIDSEPPSPTPKITRPVGRPPGPKSKAKMEAKWSAPMAQGIPSPDSSPSSITPSINDTSQFSSKHPTHHSSDKTAPKDTSNFELSKCSGDKIKPAVNNLDSNITSNNQPKISSTTAAKIQAMGLNRSVLTSGTLSSLLQNGSRSVPTISSQSLKTNAGIKVLENLTLNPSSSAKLVSSTTGRSIDLSKITVLNSLNRTKTSAGSVGNVILMPDGKIKPITTTMKSGSNPVLLPMSHKNKISSSSQTSSAGHRVKYITSKKQLIGRRPPHKSTAPALAPFSTCLPPPTNLTSQDIMDLPIIFADDNQILTDNSKLQQSESQSKEIILQTQAPKGTLSNPVGKFVFINKQVPLQTTLSSPIPTIRRPTLSVPLRNSANPVKYTKIIISRSSGGEQKPTTTHALPKMTALSTEKPIKKIESLPTAFEDIENAIISTTIKKPERHIVNLKIQKEEIRKDADNVESSPVSLGKRNATDAELNIDKEDFLSVKKQ